MSPKAKATESPTLEVEPEMTAEEQIKFLEAQLAEARAKVSAQGSEINKLKEREEGWLIVTPNPVYDSKTAGVQFTDGLAFIQKDRIFPDDPVPMTKGQEESYLAAQKKTSMDSVQVTSAERKVKELEKDFGYTAKYYTKEDMDELQIRMTERAKERADAQRILQAKGNDMLEKLVTPHRMG